MLNSVKVMSLSVGLAGGTRGTVPTCGTSFTAYGQCGLDVSCTICLFFEKSFVFVKQKY